MRYRNAFKCAKCPERADEQGCPAWVEYAETNRETGEDRLTKECSFQALPKLLLHAVAAANQAAATVDAHRNEIVGSLAAAALLYRQGHHPPTLPEPSATPATKRPQIEL